jgi:hypothetical protein
MTTATSPGENVKQFFNKYGNQIRDTGNDDSAFLNALQGLDASGKRVKGWKVYNTEYPAKWYALMKRGISEMRRSAPAYLSERDKDPSH